MVKHDGPQNSTCHHSAGGGGGGKDPAEICSVHLKGNNAVLRLSLKSQWEHRTHKVCFTFIINIVHLVFLWEKIYANSAHFLNVYNAY